VTECQITAGWLWTLDAVNTRFGQQLLNGSLGSLVLALAEVMLANASTRINEVEGWPVLVPEGTPNCVIVIDRDGVLDPHLPHRTTDVVDVPFERELRCVHADHDERVPVLLRPGANIWKPAQPVDAGVGPEIDEHDFSE
jgi:hypothetical protein